MRIEERLKNRFGAVDGSEVHEVVREKQDNRLDDYAAAPVVSKYSRTNLCPSPIPRVVLRD
jgi:hypothetical protein